jgi:RNA polymerase-binding transcription factor DksA
MSPWEEYKKKLGTTRPWDLLNPNVPHAEKEIEQARMGICLTCPELIGLTKQCKQCGCLMTVSNGEVEGRCMSHG